jgi:hypothetical protein
MGTRCEVAIMEDDTEICRIYRQFDGYPSGMGVDLANLCKVRLVNGFGSNEKGGTHANGMGCLAAQIVHGMKADMGGKPRIGNVYLQKPGTVFSDHVDYIYIVRGKEGETPVIECFENSPGKPVSIIKASADTFELAVKAYEKEQEDA